MLTATTWLRKARVLSKLRAFSPAKLRVALTPGPALRRRLLVAPLATCLLGGAYFAGLRDLSLLAVDEVNVTGLSGKDAGDVRAALESAGRSMTTLHVDRRALEDAAASFPSVRALEVDSDFPDRLKIRVVEHRPVAVLVADGKRVPIAAGGALLTGLARGRPLPSIEARGAIPAAGLGPGPALDSARVAGGAPAALAERLESIERDDDRGVVVSLGEDAPEIVFGEPNQIAAKWAAATTVLADRDAVGAQYIDVRLPGRPVAGGLPVETVAPLASAEAQEEAGLGVPGAAPIASETEGEAPATPSPGPSTTVPQSPPPGALATPAPASGNSGPTPAAPAPPELQP